MSEQCETFQHAGCAMSKCQCMCHTMEVEEVLTPGAEPQW